MIKGLTHNEEGELHKVTNYRGKISTGYAPNEPPNNTTHPAACGFFRMLKEVTKTDRIGPKKKVVAIKDWIINAPIQKALENDLPQPNQTPRRVEIVSLYRTPGEMWESSLAMYSSSDGLTCKSHGEGTNAKYLTFGPNGERNWIDREFDGNKGCPYKNCPDFKAKSCKPIGLMKCFPTVDMAPNPYRFETRSINTIIGIESSLQDMWGLLRAAHTVKELEAKKELTFEGFFGMKMYLIHRKIKSGGRDVFITNLVPTDEFIEIVMEPIKRGIADKRKQAKMLGSAGSVSMLEAAGNKLLESDEKTDPDGVVPMDTSDQQEVAVNFDADADEAEVVATEPVVAEPVVTGSDEFETKKEETSGDKGADVASTLLEDDKQEK